MTQSESKTFQEVAMHLVEQYPHRGIQIQCNEYVVIDGEVKFNCNGYNLLYNIKRLVDAIQDELL